jgi:hypothetical protein
MNISNEKKMNPGPLGLLGFGLSTILLNIHNLGVNSLNTVILAMGITLGGLAQVIAGILFLKEKNTFKGTAFTSYGLFWFSLVLVWIYKPADVNVGSSFDLGLNLLLWAIYSLVMFSATFRQNLITRIVFGLVTILFSLLAIGHLANLPLIINIAGGVGILAGISAFYDAAGQIVHEEYEKKFLPFF